MNSGETRNTLLDTGIETCKPAIDAGIENRNSMSSLDTSIETVGRASKLETRQITSLRKPIRSFLDLEVYQNTYRASILVMTKIVFKLPKEERYDLGDQMSRACKAVPRLIAEGHSKKHQNKGFQKYLDDALAESNEMIVCLSHTRDLYNKFIEPNLVENLIDLYDKNSRQLYKLRKSWQDFKANETR